MDHDTASIMQKKIYKSHVIRNSISMWWIGMINNFHYTLVLSASNSIAEGYGMKKYIALITWANVFFGIFFRLVNAFVLTFLSYNIRVTAACIMNIIAILLLCFAWDISGHNSTSAFIVSLLGVVIIGGASTYGEAVFLGYLERMPSKHVGAWSSGTGFSGVLAALIMLGLTAVGLRFPQIILVSIPLVVIYALFYFFGLYMPFRVSVEWDAEDAESNPVSHVGAGIDTTEGAQEYLYKAMTNWSGTPWTNIISPAQLTKPLCMAEMERMRHLETIGNESVDTVGEVDFNVECDEQKSKWAHWKREKWPIIKEMHSFNFWNYINLAIVYSAGYSVQFMAPFSFTCNKGFMNQSFLLNNSFVISQFCYQFGVLISRSSLICIRIRRVWIITAIQLFNAIAWLCQAKLKYMSDENNLNRSVMFSCLLFVWMFFVGLMGGASYVNVFYNILVDTKAMEQREKDDAIAFLRNPTRRESAPSTGYVEDKDQNDKSIISSGTLPQREAVCVPDNASAFLQSYNVKEACDYISSVWKEKRDLAMNIGALYATIGITIGSLLDVLFTVIFLKEESC